MKAGLKIIVLLTLAGMPKVGFTQDTLWLHVKVKDAYQDAIGHPIKLKKWAFYLGDIFGIEERGSSKRLVQGPRLIRLNSIKDTVIVLHTGHHSFKGLSIQLGVDSMLQAQPNWEGDLDPIKGMYWEWRTGYIDLKIEGHSPASNERKNEVFFHLGGFLNHESTQNRITLSFPVDDECIEVDLSSFFQAVDLSKQHKIMRPGKEAVKLSHIWKECWQIGTR
jgi:hypothetical protein